MTSDPLYYPGPNVHTDDPDTSYEAQITVNISGHTQRAIVLECLHNNKKGLTVDEVQDKTGLEEYQARRRVSELYNMGYLKRLVDRRLGHKGFSQSVMEITPSGVLAYLQMKAKEESN